jgi:hypothetical protein
MQKFWDILKKHFKEDFHWPYYITVALFLIIHLVINYRYNFENGIIDSDNGKPVRVLWYFLLYSWSYFGTIVIIWFFTKSKSLLNKKFLFFSFAGILVLSLSIGFPYLSRMIRSIIPDYRFFTWSYYTASNLISFVISSLPLLLLSTRFEKDKRELLGITPAFDVKPYLILLAIVIPMISIGAFERGLGSYYPTYKTNSVAEIMLWPQWLPVAIYEFAYAIDFFNVEYMFRGFMVIGLSHFIGKEAVMPMVVTYCFLHFGKPVGEAISSIFGGYILGVLSLYTRSIWGGVILHIAVALTMETAAFLMK